MSCAPFAFGAVEYAKSVDSGPTGTERLRATGQDAATGLMKGNMYDCGGIMANLDRVLGTRRYLWLLPLDAPGLTCALSPAAQRRLAQCTALR